jgi:hypothetical protein
MSHRVFGRVVPSLAVALLAVAPAGSVTAAAQGQISYASAPDQVAIFMNGIAYARDSFSLPRGMDARVVLPDTVFADTLVLREDGRRVARYRIDRSTGSPVVAWQSTPEPADADGGGVSEVTLEYLLAGVGWNPSYDMWLAADADERVGFDAFAEVTNGALAMEDVVTRLVAGRVDPSQMVDAVSQITANQVIAGYEDPSAVPFVPNAPAAAPTGSLDIQHVYDVGRVSAEPGDTVFLGLFEGSLPARRLHLWNAQSDDQVSVIYKVRNDSDVPLAEGIVRSYQDDLFIGSDFMELTPVGGEGSITAGFLPDVRVSRAESRAALSTGGFGYTDEVELTISNLGTVPVALEVVDQVPPEAQALQATVEPERTAGNLLRWQVTVEPTSTVVLGYEYKVE